jgi:hypothetical protein
VRSILERAGQAWLALTPRGRAVLASTLWAVATLPVLSRLAIGRAADDLKVFMNGADAVLHGPLVYRDAVFEYPPYALLWFLPPRAMSHDLDSFRLAFGLEMWAADALVKAVLLWHGVRQRRGLHDLTPFLAYSLGSAALGICCCSVSIWSLPRSPSAPRCGRRLAGPRRFSRCGWCRHQAYPALLVPVLGVFALRHGRAGLARFTGGVALASAPLAVAAFWIPWWRFASYHVERGLQAESLLASIVWALQFAGVPAGWALVWRAVEVTGPLAAGLVGPGQLLWVVATLACLASATWTAWRLASVASQPPVGAMAAVLLPIAAFVATNTVLSPQFHLWLLPLAALVLSTPPQGPEIAREPASVPPEAIRAAWCIVAATLLVPVFYPSREYGTGLGLGRTAVLVLRNGLLIYATVCLWAGVRKTGRAADSGQP